MNYLKSDDLWKSGIYNSDKFNNNLDEFKLMNIHINQIIPFYEALGKDFENNFFDDVKRQIKEEEPEGKKGAEEEEEEENPFKISDDEEEDKQNIKDRD